ncbi:MAG: hypothetical protein M1820_010149 [Bogoriella megaspora]|nr:MAG: hypothetical protein M1820_010149 [Bogoriella megaspora]
MLQAQFPTVHTRQALQRSIELKASADIDDPRISVLVVKLLHSEDVNDTQEGTVEDPREENALDRDKPVSQGEIIAFAKWSHPITKGEEYLEPPWSWPDGTNWEVLDDWTKKTEEAQERTIGDTPCYSKLNPFLTRGA